MELWIRCQDKNRLTKVDDLYIVHDDNNFCDYIGNNMVGHLAKYTKQGRAFEVLDEIQSILDFNDIRGIVVNANKINSYVYEMPKD